MESHNTDKNSNKLIIISPLKMEIRNKVTKKGVVEALTLSRWLQPFTQENDFEIEKSNIVTMSDASYALQNYYKFMVDTIGNADSSLAEDVRIQNYGQDVSDEEHEMANEEVKELFEKYIEKLTEGSKQTEIVEKDKELSDEELDTLPCSDTKH
tara:strand:- start:100 stop:561 length:462 start_codon:yes stop_codon:yes gene_type:complete